ncbi:MAG: DUF1573 domain-containing protein [Bacteroidota bacterium]
MKRIIVIVGLFILVLGIFSCRKKGESPPGAELEAELLKDTTLITLIDSGTYYFDTINEGDKVEHSFRIVNTGDKNLLIARAFGSCGCTVPQYPKDPVKPGDTATIQVTFNSAGKTNDQMKSVTVVCNTAVRNEMLYLKGFVHAKK